MPGYIGGLRFFVKRGDLGAPLSLEPYSNVVLQVDRIVSMEAVYDSRHPRAYQRDADEAVGPFVRFLVQHSQQPEEYILHVGTSRGPGGEPKGLSYFGVHEEFKLAMADLVMHWQQNAMRCNEVLQRLDLDRHP